MEIRHMCSLLLVLYPVCRDIKEKKINIFPGIILVCLGLTAAIISGDTGGWQWLAGIIPGAVTMLIGRLSGGCIGTGDGILICGIGLLEGFWFCIRVLVIAGGSIFLFSVAALLAGLVHRNSKVAFVPFLVLGYGGAGLL